MDCTTLLEAVNSTYLPNKILIVHEPGSKSFLTEDLDVLSTVEMKNGKATAYVCKNYTCTLPTSDPMEVKRILKS